jgi:hypothetical protein
MITGAGWISIGPGDRHHLFADRAVIDLSTAISWRAYKTAQARFELPLLANGHVTVGSQVLWRDLTQIVYYGAGPDSAETAESDYRLQASNAVLYGTLRSNRAVSVTGRVGWLTRVGLSPSTGPFDRDLPDTVQGTTTFARVDVAKGHEGWRFEFRLNDPFRLARLKQHKAAVPFVP